LSGNALTQTQVWGKRAGTYSAAFAKSARLGEPSKEQVQQISDKVRKLRASTSGPSVIEVRKEIRRISGENVWCIREEKGLRQALSDIARLRPQLGSQSVRGQDPRCNREVVEGLQNENMLDVLEAVATASLARQESRGATYRLDYPVTNDDRWLCNQILRRAGEGWEIREEPVKELYVTLPRGQRPYGQKGGKSHVAK
jgi:succinate dehydrogenase/fumarate reductase flavoprotein subunit